MADIDDIASFSITPQRFASLLKLIDNGTISGKIAKTVFDEMILTGDDPMKIINEKGLVQMTDVGEIETIVDRVLADNDASVRDYRNGRDKALKFLVGQVMKESKGKANPQIVNDLLLKKLQG